MAFLLDKLPLKILPASVHLFSYNGSATSILTSYKYDSEMFASIDQIVE